MQRPLPPTLLRYAAHDIVIMARLYAHFCQSPGAYFGDVPALRLVRTLRTDGRTAWGIAIGTPEAPEVADAADVTVADPDELVALLRRAL